MWVVCMCIRDWRGAGFIRGPAVPRGPRGSHLHISAGRCGPMILIAGPLFQSMRSSMAAFNDTKTSSDPPVTHVPFADYVIAVQYTVPGVPLKTLNIHTLVIQKATCCQLHNNIHLSYPNTVVDLIDLPHAALV